MEQRREHLNHHFGVNLKRAPVVNTLRTVLQSLPTETLEEAFRRHAKTLLPADEAGKQPVIAFLCLFDIDAACLSEAEPGTGMVLDDEGKLCPSATAYDKRAALGGHHNLRMKRWGVTAVSRPGPRPLLHEVKSVKLVCPFSAVAALLRSPGGQA